MQEDKRKIVLDLITQGRSKALKASEKASVILKTEQLIIDLMDASEKFIKECPDEKVSWEQIEKAWEYNLDQQNCVLEGLHFTSCTSLAASGSSASSAMIEYTGLQEIWGFDTSKRKPDYALELIQVIERNTEKNSVLDLLRECNLNTAPTGKKTPLELFEAAWEAFEKPVTPEFPASNTSLIPIRECINLIIQILLTRRPKQEPTGNERRKMQSICNQLAFDSVSAWAKDSLADKWYGLNDELSGSKNKKMSRCEWGVSLRRATLLIKELLESIDMAKMK